jgi:uncharacterized membrane protein
MLKLIRTMIIGGIIFLIPIAIFVAAIGQGLKIAGAIAKPVAAVLPVNMIGGVAVAHVLAIVLLLLICFVAGLLARLALARKAVGALEANVLSRLPPYALLKTKTQSMLSPDDIEGMSVVVVRFDDSWQIGFEIERIEGGKVALFLPGSPDPWSGSVCIAEEDRVTPLDLPVAAVASMVRRLGRGANEALRDRLRSTKHGGRAISRARTRPVGHYLSFLGSAHGPDFAHGFPQRSVVRTDFPYLHHVCPLAPQHQPDRVHLELDQATVRERGPDLARPRALDVRRLVDSDRPARSPEFVRIIE